MPLFFWHYRCYAQQRRQTVFFIMLVSSTSGREKNRTMLQSRGYQPSHLMQKKYFLCY
ncbi:50S ribosomal protein L1 [Escherichia coli DEC14A]|nr:hypothetical protein ECSTEC94C_3657 [Escherichia coli STEC_94C]EHX74610.1 50S ribosomal protein L1 [Escherichia coli DEC14A]